MQSLTREAILGALARLDEKLKEQNIKGEICLVGGSVMVYGIPGISTLEINLTTEFFRRTGKEDDGRQTTDNRQL